MTLELRYPVMLEASTQIYALAFAEGGNAWTDVKKFNPFNMKRSAGVGVRIFLPMIGLMGIDWGYGFDKVFGRSNNGGSQFALIDMEYILQHIPAYEQAMAQMDADSKKYQNEVEAISQEAKKLYEAYQQEADKLTAAQRTQRENAIVAKEKQAAELRQQYFGPQGTLAQKQQQLLQPINDSIYETVKTISLRRGLSLVLDRASDHAIIFASPAIDISDEVLSILGYSN